MIRIGSSCALSIPMAIGKVVETRRFIGSQSDWDKVAQYCIQNKIYLIVTLCINRNDGSGHYPNNDEWVNFVNDTCIKLQSFGANKFNCRISLVNEPMKFCSKEEYVNLINIAYPLIKKYYFLVSCGNEEFITAQAKGNMYQYILANCQFDILDVHIQGSCDTAKKTKDWCNEVNRWTNKPKDCPEAFYGNASTASGFELLKAQLDCAENILKCENFCNVFNNLDTSMFPWDTSSWHKLCFKINGVLRSNYWAQWKILMDTKAPIPNINIPIIEEEDMKLEKYYYKNKGTYNRDPKKAGVKFIQTVVNVKPDGDWGTITDEAVKDYQADFDLDVDAIVGPLTFREMMKTHERAYIDLQYFVAVGDW